MCRARSLDPADRVGAGLQTRPMSTTSSSSTCNPADLPRPRNRAASGPRRVEEAAGTRWASRCRARCPGHRPPDSGPGRVLTEDRTGAQRGVGAPQRREHVGAEDHRMTVPPAIRHPQHRLVRSGERVQRRAHGVGPDQRHVDRQDEHARRAVRLRERDASQQRRELTKLRRRIVDEADWRCRRGDLAPQIRDRGRPTTAIVSKPAFLQRVDELRDERAASVRTWQQRFGLAPSGWIALPRGQFRRPRHPGIVPRRAIVLRQRHPRRFLTSPWNSLHFPRFKLSVRRTEPAPLEGGWIGRSSALPGTVGPRLLPAPPQPQLADLRDNPGGSVASEDTVCQAGRSLDF